MRIWTRATSPEVGSSPTSAVRSPSSNVGGAASTTAAFGFSSSSSSFLASSCLFLAGGRASPLPLADVRSGDAEAATSGGGATSATTSAVSSSPASYSYSSSSSSSSESSMIISSSDPWSMSSSPSWLLPSSSPFCMLAWMAAWSCSSSVISRMGLFLAAAAPAIEAEGPPAEELFDAAEADAEVDDVGRGATGGRWNEWRLQKSAASSANCSAVIGSTCVHPSFFHMRRPVRGSMMATWGYERTL
mmetsp:Transcript_42653/g.129531  ORF Transcript_42653/g.129531 Transcript_42653/m.129531 type:complete len:246 (-) Transcript_42653:529-1266(-)